MKSTTNTPAIGPGYRNTKVNVPRPFPGLHGGEQTALRGGESARQLQDGVPG